VLNSFHSAPGATRLTRGIGISLHKLMPPRYSRNASISTQVLTASPGISPHDEVIGYILSA